MTVVVVGSGMIGVLVIRAAREGLPQHPRAMR
jgi:threonine dehydrogenase-like Zn-dependent dehydrogenase